MGYLGNKEEFFEAKKIAENLKKISGGKILDIATIDGDFIQVLIDALKDYESFVGIDFSQQELEKAKNRFKTQQNIEFLKMNAESLEFEDDSFDTVCISFSLHHLDKIDKVLAEMKRVLKSGGYFIIQESYCDGEQTEAQKTEILQHHWSAEVDSLLGGAHQKTFTQKKIQSIIKKLGLKHLELFNSPWYVKCLFCSELKKCMDPKYKNGIELALKEIKRDLKRIQKHSEFPRLKEQAEKIKERIKKYGVASASVLFFIGKK